MGGPAVALMPCTHTVCLHDGYASISPVTDQSEHSILISIEQILISIERSARYELVLVPVDGHTVLEAIRLAARLAVVQDGESIPIHPSAPA